MTIVPNLEPTDTLTFHQALLQAEAQARSTLAPDLHERLSAAVGLVKTGRTFQSNDGIWQVESTSQAGRVYSVNGACACEDHHYNHPPQGLCKHRIAMFLSQRVLTLMRQPPAPVVPELVEPWPDNDPEDVPQSPTVETEPAQPAPTREPHHGMRLETQVMIDGHHVKVALWGPDDADVQTRLQAVLAQYPATQAPAQGQDDTPQCPTHGALRKGKRGWYCPHKLADDTWCKSKAK